MALWDAAAKIAGLPLHQFPAGRLGRDVTASQVPVYASGGYPYPEGDIAALSQEIRHFADLGFTYVKIKIGSAPLDHDLRRIEAAAAHLAGTGHLAVDAMNAYDPRRHPGSANRAAVRRSPASSWPAAATADPPEPVPQRRSAPTAAHPLSGTDERIPREASLALFDAFASKEKIRPRATRRLED